MIKEKYKFSDLLEIMNILRSENGCPWDKEQDHESLRRYLIEETYEVLESIDMEDKEGLCEELGDLLLQIVFHSQIAAENGHFNIEDVINKVCKKMIRRHAHVFGNDKANTALDVVEKWENIKKIEKKQSKCSESLKEIPLNLPALMRSYKVQEKASRVGFDWDDIENVFEKILEEINELKSVYKSENVEKITDETGDVLFSVVNLARFIGISPELALTGTTNKFIKRFEYIENESQKRGKALEDMSISEMDNLWNDAKKALEKEK